MRIVFMGTPDIAAACLEKLLTEHMNVVAVYTKPDTPQNRGMKLTQSPVKRVALAPEGKEQDRHTSPCQYPNSQYG